MAPRSKPIIVELGYGDPEFMHRLGRRYKRVRHVGIDKKPVVHSQNRPENVELVEDHWDTGLKKFKPGEIHGINSRLSVGYYGKPPHMTAEEYTQHVANIAFEQLPPGKRFNNSVDFEHVDRMLDVLRKAGFKTGWEPLRKGEKVKSAWTGASEKWNVPLFKVWGEKPK